MRNQFRGTDKDADTAKPSTVSELPVVAALLVAAVIVALLAAGGPVIDLLAGSAQAS